MICGSMWKMLGRDTIKGVEVFLWTTLISVCAGVAVLLVERKASFLGKIF